MSSSPLTIEDIIEIIISVKGKDYKINKLEVIEILGDKYPDRLSEDAKKYIDKFPSFIELSDYDIRKRLGAPLSTTSAVDSKDQRLKPFFKKKSELTTIEIKNLIDYSIYSGLILSKDTFLKMLDYFTYKCNLIADSINKRAHGKELFILVPGDSGEKIVTYIKILNLCPTCKFIEFPISRDILISREEVKIDKYWKELNRIIPNVDLTNIVFLDYIYSGSTIHKILDEIFINERINKNLISREINMPIIEEIKRDIIINFQLRERSPAIYRAKNMQAEYLPPTPSNILKYYTDNISCIKLTNPDYTNNVKLKIEAILMNEAQIIIKNSKLSIELYEEIKLLRSPNQNIIDIGIYFKNIYSKRDTGSAYWIDYLQELIWNGERDYDRIRCQPKMELKNLYISPQLYYDPLHCRFFAYLASIYSKNKKTFTEVYPDAITVNYTSEHTLEFIIRNLKKKNPDVPITKSMVTEKIIEHDKMFEIVGSQLSLAAKKLFNSLPTSGGYYNKYLKYKQKYLQLKSFI